MLSIVTKRAQQDEQLLKHEPTKPFLACFASRPVYSICIEYAPMCGIFYLNKLTGGSMRGECAYLYIGGMRVPTENVLVTVTRNDGFSAQFRVAAKSPGSDRGTPPTIKTIKELKELTEDSTIVAHMYDPASGRVMGDPFEFNTARAEGTSGRKHAAKEGRSPVWAQFEPDEFVAGLLAKGVSYGVSEGLDDINTGQLDWLARTLSGKVVLEKLVKSSDPGVNDVKHTLAAAIDKAQKLGVPIPLSKELLESFAKLVPIAETLGFSGSGNDPHTILVPEPSGLPGKLKTEFPSELQVLQAQDPKSSQESLMLMATQGDPVLHVHVAQNPNTPFEALDHLGRNSRSDHVLSVLAGSPDPRLRKRVAENPATSLRDLVLLADDANSDVRLTATAMLLEHPEDDVRIKMATRQISHNQAVRLTKDRSPSVREALVRNQSIEPDILKSMADEDDNERVLLALSTVRDPGVQVRLARNRALPREAADMLASEGSPEAQMALAENPRTSLGTIHRLIRRRDREVLMILSRHPEDAVRELLAESEDTSEEILMKLVYDRRHAILRALVRNRRTPREALSMLTKSDYMDLREIAIQRLGGANRY